MDLSWTTDYRDGVTLVACRLENSAPIARRVRLENELDGPVLPPRSHGVPLPGWDADGVTLRIEPETTAAVGYAVPAPAAEPPASVALDEPAREDATGVPHAIGPDPDPMSGHETSAADAVRTLGAYRPPRDAVAGGESDRSGSGKVAASARADGAEKQSNQQAATTTQPTVPETDSRGSNPSRTSQIDPPTASPADPAAVDAWLDAVERRVARAEQLDGADVSTATEAVAKAGGLDAVRELDRKIDDDAERLRTAAERAAALADRAAEAEVPTEPLGRLA